MRTWTATDACGNRSTAQQRIIKPIVRITPIIDTIAPQITFIDPIALTARNGDTLKISDCRGAKSLQMSSVRVTDNRDTNPSVFLDSTVINGVCPTNDYMILKRYIWTAVDSSGNRSTVRLWLKFVDDVPPFFSNVPPNVTIQATQNVPIAVVSATDACSNIVVDSTITRAIFGIDTIFIRSWTATDLCGNVSIANQSVLKLGTRNNGSSTVWTPKSDTIHLQLVANQSDTICLRKKSNSGGYTIRNICPDSTTRAGMFEILRGDTCVVVRAVGVGRSTACFQVCDSTGVCDTTVLTLNSNLLAQLAKPIVVDDEVQTRRATPIDIQIVKNDTLGSSPVNSISMMLQPRFGRAEVRQKGGDWLIHFQPDSVFCSSKLKDEFYYELCTAGGCGRAFVRVRVLCDGLKVFNAFSPNGDSQNDVFFIEGLDFFPNTSVTIYNRWGNSIYSSKNYRNDWNGTFDSGVAPDGTYFYIVRLENGETFNGYLQIAR